VEAEERGLAAELAEFEEERSLVVPTDRAAGIPRLLLDRSQETGR
jgi:hypothetical protein